MRLLSKSAVMNEAAAILACSALAVFLRAIQQQNVIRGLYPHAVATSFAIAIADAIVILSIVSAGLWAIPWFGLGGAIGVTSAMWIHRRYIR